MMIQSIRQRILTSATVLIVLAIIGIPVHAAHAAAAKDYRLVKTASDPKIFLVKENRRIHIPNPSVFEAGGYRWNEVKTILQKEMDGIPDTALIKSPVDAKVYLIIDGKKAWIPNEQAFLGAGLKWGDIVLISQAQVDFYNETIFDSQSIVEIVTPKKTVERGENKSNSYIRPDDGQVIEIDSVSKEIDKEVLAPQLSPVPSAMADESLLPKPIVTPFPPAPAVYTYQPPAPPQWQREYILPKEYSYPQRTVFAERMLDDKWKIIGAPADSFDSEYLSARINNNGQIATNRLVGNGSKWTRIPDLPGGEGVYIRSFNDNGQAVGKAQPTREDDANGHAFLWSDGKIKDLGAVWGKYSESTAVGINNKGQVVGYYRDREGYHAVLWEKDKIIKLGSLSKEDFLVIPAAINDLGQIVGDTETEDGQRKLFIWENGAMKEMKGFSDKKASYILADINNKGQVIGSYWVSDEKTGEGYNGIFIWENGEMRDVGIDNASVSDINNKGEIVGSRYKKGWGYYGFIWKNGETIPLNDFLPDSEIDQHNFDDSLSINDDGHIIGRGSILNLSGNILSAIKKKPTVNIPIQPIEKPKLIEIPSVTTQPPAEEMKAYADAGQVKVEPKQAEPKLPVMSAEENEAYRKDKIRHKMEQRNSVLTDYENASIRNLSPQEIEFDFTGDTYTITWEAVDPQSDRELILYYRYIDSDSQYGRDILIRKHIPVSDEQFVWDLSDVPNTVFTIRAYFDDVRGYVYSKGALDKHKQQ